MTMMMGTMVRSMLALAFLWSANAFTIQPYRSQRHVATWATQPDKESSIHQDRVQESPLPMHNVAQGIARAFQMVAVASVITFSAAPLPAVSADSTFASSIQIADSITTMDLSLPSYGDISSPKASVGTVSSLTIEAPKEGVGVKARKPAASKKSKDVGDGGGFGIDVSKVLPSLAKGPKTTTEAASAPKVRRAEKVARQKDDDEPAVTAVKFMDTSMPSYGETAAIKDTNPFRL